MNRDTGNLGNGRVCWVCGVALEGKRRKYCASCAGGLLRTPGKPADAGGRAGGGPGPLRGLSIDEIARMAWDTYGMSYGKLVGYVRETGRLPPRR